MGKGGALTYFVFEHIMGIKFQQAVFPPASEASHGEVVEVFLGLFCPGLRQTVLMPISLSVDSVCLQSVAGHRSKDKEKGEVSRCRCYSNAPKFLSANAQDTAMRPWYLYQNSGCQDDRNETIVQQPPLVCERQTSAASVLRGHTSSLRISSPWAGPPSRDAHYQLDMQLPGNTEHLSRP